MGLREALRGVDEGRVPAPAVDSGQAHAALKQIERRLRAHAAARGEHSRAGRISPRRWC